MTTPASLPAFIFSSLVRKWATKTVHSGVVALRMDARPLAMWVCPQTIRLNGSRLLRKPMAMNATHARRSDGMCRPIASTATLSASAAIPTRSTTMVNGGRPSTATPTK